MKIASLLCALTLTVSAATKPEEFTTPIGTLTITPIQHASFMIEVGGQVIYVDPVLGNYDDLKPADMILITDIHEDHFSPSVIAKIRKAGTSTTIIAPEVVAKNLTETTVMHNGETRRVLLGVRSDSRAATAWTIEAVPMYNLKRGPAAGQFYHDKGRGNGYILTYGGMRFYIAGDTEGTPEMRTLKNIDVAFIPMNLPYTMPPEEAAEAVREFHPKIVYPYHYEGSDPKVFQAALKGTGIEVRLRDWYAQ